MVTKVTFVGDNFTRKAPKYVPLCFHTTYGMDVDGMAAKRHHHRVAVDPNRPTDRTI